MPKRGLFLLTPFFYKQLGQSQVAILQLLVLYGNYTTKNNSCIMPVLITTDIFTLVFHRILEFKTGLNFYSGPIFFKHMPEQSLEEGF